MADRRYIAQSITDSGQVYELVARCGPWAGIFFTWLIPFWDDDHRIQADPAALQSKIFARYQQWVTVEQIREFIASANDCDLVVLYEVAAAPGERYLYSPRFSRHQTLRADRYGPSRYPAPPGWQPDDDHPYGKNPDLRKAKPARDPRRTHRVPIRKESERPVITWATTWLATSPQPPRDQDAPMPRPLGDPNAPRGDEASRHVTPPLLSSRHVTPPQTGTAAKAAEDAGRTPSALLDSPLLGEARHARLNDERVFETLLPFDAAWLPVATEIALRVRAAVNFATWFSGTRLLEGTAVPMVVFPNAYARDWVRQHYDRAVREALAAVDRDPTRVQYLTEQEAAIVTATAPHAPAAAQQAEPEIPDEAPVPRATEPEPSR